MKKTILMIFPFILFVFGIASAEFYKYTDSNGNIRYTDDLSKVPESQRPNVTSYEESEYSVPPAAPTIKSETGESSPETAPQANIDLNAQRGQIQQKQENLEKEFQALMDEKKQLAEASKEEMSIDDRLEIDRKIKKLNEKISQYDQKRKDLNTEIKEFNVKMSKKKEDEKQ